MSSHELLLNRRYEIEREIGRGGMSVVYYVKDHRLHKYWAMKKVCKDSNSVYASFLNEVRMLTHIQHKGIPKCIDFFEDDTAGYMIMEWIHGMSLNVYGTRYPITKKLLISWMSELCDIFLYLQMELQMAVLYLDLKPHNVLVDEELHIHLIDFGSACFAGNVSSVVSGTPRIYCT